MKLLLDSHTLLWSLARTDRLSGRARDLVEDPENELLVSAVTGMELATKHRVGKLPEAGDLLARWPRELARLGADSLALSVEHALLAGSMSWEHRDPFDRLLVAQAIIEDAALVTNDRAITAGSTARVIW